jgi:hypothetical protein
MGKLMGTMVGWFRFMVFNTTFKNILEQSIWKQSLLFII